MYDLVCPAQAHIDLFCDTSAGQLQKASDTKTSSLAELVLLPRWQYPADTCAIAAQINLVATQLVLDREHNNRLVFDGQEGLDPVVDLSLRGAKIRALIQGRASTWHNNLLLTPISSPAGEAVGSTPFRCQATCQDGHVHQ